MKIRDLRAKLRTMNPRDRVVVLSEGDPAGTGRRLFASPTTGRHLTVAGLLAETRGLDPDSDLELQSRRTGAFARVLDVGAVISHG